VLGRLRPFEEASMRARPPEVRPVLAALGAPIHARTWGEDRPRRA
jgi:hypothetical protein